MERLLLSAIKILGPRALARLAFLILEYLAKRTDNRLDDELVALVKSAFDEPSQSDYM